MKSKADEAVSLVKSPQEILLDILTELSLQDPEDITPETRLKEDLELESMDLLDMRFQIEEKLGLKIDDPTAQSWKTVSDVLAYIITNRMPPENGAGAGI